MKNGITNKIKVWFVLTIAILIAGILFFAFAGFNNSVDFKNSYEAVVSVDDYDIENAELAKTEVEKYFNIKGYKFIGDAEQVIESSLGYEIIYKFDYDIKLDTEELEKVVSKLYDDSYNMVVEAEYRNVVINKDSQAGWIILSLAIATVVCFLYVLIFEKGIGALSMVLASIFGSLVYLAIVAIVRIPANAYLGVATCFAFALSAILSSGMINRFREEIRINQAKNNEKLSFGAIADKAAEASKVRYFFVFVALAIVSLVFIIAGTLTVKVLGLHILAVALGSIFTSFFGTPVIWSLFKGLNANK